MTTGTSRGIAAIGIAAALLGAFLYMRSQNASPVTTFAECKAAGYQIMESYPEQCRTPDGRTFVNDSAPPAPTGEVTTGKEDKIRVTNVVANQIVASPLTVEGVARGYWYFEASFPVELVDGNGKSLAMVPAQAKSEWMTTDFVPFSVTLSFAKPSTATGTLILRNDNPSGLPENADEIRIPVRFSTTERSIRLYYYNSNLDKDGSGNILCSSKGLVGVSRTIPVTQTPLQDTLRLLLRGELTSSERANSITTEFPLPGVTLTGATISASGATVISISDPSLKTSGGSCRVNVLRAQIEATARQFDSVKSVSFSPITILQP